MYKFKFLKYVAYFGFVQSRFYVGTYLLFQKLHTNYILLVID